MGAWGALAHPMFGRTVNPISTKGADYTHHSTTSPPRIFRPCDGPATTCSSNTAAAVAGAPILRRRSRPSTPTTAQAAFYIKDATTATGGAAETLITPGRYGAAAAAMLPESIGLRPRPDMGPPTLMTSIDKNNNRM